MGSEDLDRAVVLATIEAAADPRNNLTADERALVAKWDATIAEFASNVTRMLAPCSDYETARRYACLVEQGAQQAAFDVYRRSVLLERAMRRAVPLMLRAGRPRG